MVEIHFAPAKKPWNDAPPVLFQQRMVSHGFKVERTHFASHSMACKDAILVMGRSCSGLQLPLRRQLGHLLAVVATSY